MEDAVKAWILIQIAEAVVKFPQIKPLSDKAIAELTKMAEDTLKEDASDNTQRRQADYP